MVSAAIGGIFIHALLYPAALFLVYLVIYLSGRKNGGITDHIAEQSRRKQYSRQMKQILLEASTYEDYLRQIVRL